MSQDSPLYPPILFPDLSCSSASSVPLRFKGFDFPITAIPRDDGDSGDLLLIRVIRVVSGKVCFVQFRRSLALLAFLAFAQSAVIRANPR